MNAYYIYRLTTLHKYITIIPNVKYLLKSESDAITIKPLFGICTNFKIYQYPCGFHSYCDPSCEWQILLEGNSSQLPYTKLTIEKSDTEIISQINRYIAIFPHGENHEKKVYKKCWSESFKWHISINENNYNVFFRNQKFASKSETFGKPIIIYKINLNIASNRIYNINIQLKAI